MQDPLYGTHSYIYGSFTKENDFNIFLFASLDDEIPQNLGQLLKKNIPLKMLP